MTNKVMKKTIHRLEKYTTRSEFQTLLPSDERFAAGFLMQHQFTIQQVNGETKVGHKFSKDVPKWAKLLYLKVFKTFATFGNQDPREWCKGWLNWEFKFSILLRGSIRFVVSAHPWYALGMLDKKIMLGLRNQIEIFNRQLVKKYPQIKLSPLMYYESMCKLREEKDGEIMVELLPATEEIPQINEPVENLHDIRPEDVKNG